MFKERDVQQAECAIRCAVILGCFLAKPGVVEVLARTTLGGELNNKLNTVVLLNERVKQRVTVIENEARRLQE